jgi:nitrogen fixation/metabolism regulation signal transduction histidine kinase
VTIESLLQQPVIWSLAVLAIGVLASLTGGALAGIAIGGKQFGLQLATQMGGLFGLLAAVPGLVIALLALALIG